MGSRILIEILILLSPFAIYGLYRLAIEEAAAEGKKPWPIQRLFIIGFVLAIVAWLGFLIWDKSRSNTELCKGPSVLVDGKIRPGPEIPCPRDVKNIGIPASDDPGGGSLNLEPAGEGDG